MKNIECFMEKEKDVHTDLGINVTQEKYLAFNENCWSLLTDNVVKGNYVLVIGNEAVLDKDKTEGISDSKEYFEKIRDRCRKNGDFADMSKYDQILQIIKHHKFDGSDVSSNLRNILKTKCFRVVLTTNYDPYIETVMKDIWGEDLVVRDIFGDRGSGFDIDNAAKSDEFFDVKPVLYYVFGKADPNNAVKEFAVNDNDLIKVIAKWMNANTRPVRLMEYLKRKELLAVGCKFSDWYFRFFWYCLREDVSRLKCGKVAMSLNLEDGSVGGDVDLGKYLKTQKVYTFPNTEDFLKILSSKLNEIKNSLKNMRNKGGVFISYASEDSAMAALIFSKLREENFNVWMDSSRLYGGDNYDERIEKAINECKVFLPILSKQMLTDFKKKDEERYYMKEWKIAGPLIQKATDATAMVPVVLDGYDIKHECHKTFEEMTARRTAFDFSKQPISDLFELIKKYL